MSQSLRTEVRCTQTVKPSFSRFFKKAKLLLEIYEEVTALPKKKNTSNGGTAIKIEKNRLVVPNDPIIPFIKADGTGPGYSNASVRVFDAAVSKAYKNKKRINWKEILRVNAPSPSVANGFPKRPSTPLRNTK